MSNKNNNIKKWPYTVVRAILFCLSCAATLATVSAVVKGLPNAWSQHLLLIIASAITFGITVLFVRWEKLKLSDVGVVPGRFTFKRLAIGFLIGMILAFLQSAFVLLCGHFKFIYSSVITFIDILLYLSLYILVAVREELAFRGFPLRSLNYSIGPWKAQLIIVTIFSLEHVAGGMTWRDAFLGAGTGAVLFGLAALKTKGLALPIGLHIAWNFGQWCMGFKKEAGLLQGISDKGYENIVERNAWVGYLLVMGIAIVFFYFYKPKRYST